jgi:hypothetical protein
VIPIPCEYYLHEFLIPHGIGITRKQKISNKYYLHEFLIPHGIGITRKQKKEFVKVVFIADFLFSGDPDTMWN